MSAKDKTAYCGIYCPDCIHFQNEYSGLAEKLENHLKEIEFAKYAEVKSPFGEGFKHWKEFSGVLNTLANTKCDTPCRPGGGCSGDPCKIMECCLGKDIEGCWKCSEFNECDKFEYLEPRCGQMPKNNIREIQKCGLDNWIEKRDKFYIWQK